MNKLNPTEYDECLALVHYLELRGFLFTHIPAETFTRSWGIKMKNKRMGVRSGFPDYVAIVKGRLFFIEMKRKKGSKVSPEQRQWIEELNKVPNVVAAICRGADEAIELIESHE